MTAPRAYYNEFNPKAAAWLRELIKAGLIAEGDVDERSIADVDPADVAEYSQCHFFAGIGGWSYALRLAGWPDDRPVWTGSCPCQPFSSAGRRKGTADSRHLWPQFLRLISACRPPVVFGEQVASKDGMDWLSAVLADLDGTNFEGGGRIYALRALARRTSGSGFTGWGSPGTPNLSGWLTPVATDGEIIENVEWALERGRHQGGRLSNQVQFLPEGAPVKEKVHGRKRTGSGAVTESTDLVSPEFVQWLMGYPTEWTSCGATAMRSSRSAEPSS